MSLETPTTQETYENIIAGLQAALNQTIPLLPKSFNRVLAKVLAAVFILLYKYGGSILLNIFVATAQNAETEINGKPVNPLVFWGRLIGIGDPTPATQAEFYIDVTVNNQTGNLDAGAQLIGATNGVTYLTTDTAALDAALITVPVRAAADQTGGQGAGAIGNLNPGDALSFANPLANVDRGAVVSLTLPDPDWLITTGADAEQTEVYRQRIIDRFQKQPQGGAYADYKIWGEEAAGIIKVYPYTGDPGEVDLYSEAVDQPDGIPTSAQLADVLDKVTLDENGLATRRPANAWVNSYPIERIGFDVRILGITGVDNLPEVEADIEAALTEYFLAAEPFIAGLDVPPRKDQLTRVSVSALAEDIISAAGGTFTDAIMSLAATSVGIWMYSLGEGEKAKLNSVSFI